MTADGGESPSVLTNGMTHPERPRLPFFSEILVEANTLRVEAEIPEDLYYFEGHFPQQKIVPGFILLAWIIYILEKGFGLQELPPTTRSIKFQTPLFPGDFFALELKRESKEKFSFSVQSKHSTVSSGVICF